MRIYDLKGSRVARMVDTKGAKPSTTLKDMNFFRNQSDQEVNLSLKDKEHLCEIMEADSRMLQSLNIMDYSLLLGIEKKEIDMSDSRNMVNSLLAMELIERKASKNSLDAAVLGRHQFCSPDLQYIYHVSIIDYLQLWNFNK